MHKCRLRSCSERFALPVSYHMSFLYNSPSLHIKSKMLPLPKPTTALTSKSSDHSPRLKTCSSIIEQGVDVLPDNHSLTTSNSDGVISAFLKSQHSSCISPTGQDNDTPTPSRKSASSANNILPAFLTFSPETKRHVRAHMRAKVSTKRVSV